MSTRTGTFLDRCHEAGRSALVNGRTGAVLAARLEMASTRAARRRGLLGRHALAAGTGLAIVPCSSIHTWFMRFAIDVLFVARDGRVLRIAPTVPAWRIRVAWRAFAAVELPAGTAEKTDTRVGDRVYIEWK